MNNEVVELFHGEACHDLLYKNMKQELAFAEGADFEAWKKELRARLEKEGIEV